MKKWIDQILDNIALNSAKSIKAPDPPLPSGIRNALITLEFCKDFDINNIEIVKLNSFEEFFLFYMENHDKGCIYDVRLIKGEL